MNYGYVYELIDPRNSKCFYIGLTKNKVARLKSHLNKKCATSAGYVENILNSGCLPVMNIIAELPYDEAWALEKKLIKEFRKAKIPIANNKYGHINIVEHSSQGKKWDDNSINALNRMIGEGLSLREISLHLKRTEKAITKRISKINSNL